MAGRAGIVVIGYIVGSIAGFGIGLGALYIHAGHGSILSFLLITLLLGIGVGDCIERKWIGAIPTAAAVVLIGMLVRGTLVP